MEVFATPALVALMENAAMHAVQPALPEGSTTVGAMIQTTHLKHSGLGEEVTDTAELTEVEGRKLTFKVSASDRKGLVGEGTHIRYIVDRERFLSKLYPKESKWISRHLTIHSSIVPVSEENTAPT